MTLLPRFDQESALNELVNNPVTAQPPNPIATLDGFDSVQLNQEVSRVISASQLTTIFTSITPRRTAEGVATTINVPESAVSQDPLPPPNFDKLIEIGIVFVVLGNISLYTFDAADQKLTCGSRRHNHCAFHLPLPPTFKFGASPETARKGAQDDRLQGLAVRGCAGTRGSTCSE